MSNSSSHSHGSPNHSRRNSTTDNEQQHNVLDQHTIQGYFGSGQPITDSNATLPDGQRIVLSEHYGEQQLPTEPSEPLLRQRTDSATSTSTTSSSSLQQEEPHDMEGLAGRYKNKVVIITGGCNGIGEGCTRVFFAAGSNVVIADRDVTKGNELMNELNSPTTTLQNNNNNNNRILFVKTDVSKVEQIQNMINITIKEFNGQINCLINNVGWHPQPKTIDEFTIDEMQDLFQLNFISTFTTCKLSLPYLRKSIGGNIINISSWVGIHGQANATTYAATKGAITSFSKALAIDEASLASQSNGSKNSGGVRVNIVSPGNIWTPLWKLWSDGEDDPKAACEAGDRVQIMGRKGTIIETGKLCLCIAADLTFTTGVDHIQSGGAELGYGVKS